LVPEYGQYVVKPVWLSVVGVTLAPDVDAVYPPIFVPPTVHVGEKVGPSYVVVAGVVVVKTICWPTTAFWIGGEDPSVVLMVLPFHWI
jgi:hypothetical protein